MTRTYFNDQISVIETLLFGFAMKLTKNRENAKDLMQETLMRGFENRDHFKIGTHFKSWMTTIMYNSFVNHYRKAKTRNKIMTPVEEVVHLADRKVTEGNAESKLMQEELNNILKTVDLKFRKAFLMFFKGYQYDEISEKMNVPIGTIKSRIFYARKQLKKRIQAKYQTAYLMST
ncbi:MAG: RNA polymerase sigma factor (sigma-70 family) [Saprospiraceae bacterium]|jgi:RNA polymerase sigma factor (sigma-70 family)